MTSIRKKRSCLLGRARIFSLGEPFRKFFKSLQNLHSRDIDLKLRSYLCLDALYQPESKLAPPSGSLGTKPRKTF